MEPANNKRRFEQQPFELPKRRFIDLPSALKELGWVGSDQEAEQFYKHLSLALEKWMPEFTEYYPITTEVNVFATIAKIRNLSIDKQRELVISIRYEPVQANSFPLYDEIVGIIFNTMPKIIRDADYLYREVCRGHFDSIAQLHRYGADFSIIRDRVTALLHDHVLSSNVFELAKLILFGVVDLNAPNSAGQTPLQVACDKSDLGMVELLIKNGARQDNVTWQGISLKRVIDAGTSICKATNYKHANVIPIDIIFHKYVQTRTFLEKLSKIIPPNLFVVSGGFVDVPATIKSLRKNRNIVWDAILANLGIFISAGSGNNPVEFKNNIKIVFGLKSDFWSELLIVLQRDPNEKVTFHGSLVQKMLCTDLSKHKLEREFQIKIIDYMLANGISLNEQNSDGNTPIHVMLLQAISVDTISLLVERGADLEIRNKQGDTPFWFYLHKSGSEKKVNYFISTTKDINQKHPRSGSTLMHMLAFCSEATEQNILHAIDKGGDVNITDVYNRTPLHTAVLLGSEVKVAMLLQAGGAVTNVKDSGGHTPLDLANDLHLDVIAKQIKDFSELKRIP